MAYQFLTLKESDNRFVEKELGNQGKFYNNTISVLSSSISDDYIFPAACIEAVGVSWDSGTPTIQFSFSDEDAIKAGTAQWVAWDLTSKINPAVKGVRITNLGLTNITLEVSIRAR